MNERTLFDPPEDEPDPKTKVCPCCGAKMVRHRHRLSAGLLSGLVILEARSPWKSVNLRELGLSRTQWDNFQKLRYWGLVEHHGSTKSGVWSLSDLGRQFLANVARVQPVVFTYRGEVVSYDGDAVTAEQVLRSTPFFDRYEEYRAGQR
jgi:hypothetical protein